MPQAGSTLCYNLARLLVEKSLYTLIANLQDPPTCLYFYEGTNIDRYYDIVKQHDLAPDLRHRSTWPDNVYVINIKRDLRDTIASATRKLSEGKELDILETCERNLEWHGAWTSLVDYEWVYESYKKSPLKIVQELQKTLKLNLDVDALNEVIAMAENLKTVMSSLDDADHQREFANITRMDKAQITNNGQVGGYKKTLTEEQIELIETTYNDWLVENGYMT
tara:strand:+ start:386 stop:1051 length:666 start_codon:yes stop_codon:yes gene_type:complete